MKTEPQPVYVIRYHPEEDERFPWAVERHQTSSYFNYLVFEDALKEHPTAFVEKRSLERYIEHLHEITANRVKV